MMGMTVSDMTTKTETGTFFCSHWKDGSREGGRERFWAGYALLNCNFDEALRTVAGILGMDNANPLPIPPTRPQAQPRPEKTKSRNWRHYGEAQNLSALIPPVIQYLKSRGLDMAHLPETSVSYLKDYWTTGGDKPLLLGRFPCMVCAIRDMDEELQRLTLDLFAA